MTFDVILVHALGRLHNHYLSVVRHLGRRLRIGIWVAALDKRIKTEATERLFLDLSREFGAEIVEPGTHACRLLGVPQYRYQPGFLEALIASVRSERRVAFQTFGHGPENLEPLARIGVARLWVYDRRVFDNKPGTLAQRRFLDEHFDIVEMGAPFARYPVFDDVAADYLVAFPTELSFPDAHAKAAFVANVNRLLAAVPAGDAVVVKLHNVADGGRLVERASRAFALGVRLGAAGLGLPPLPLPGRLGRGWARAAFGAGFARLDGRACSLDRRTPYFNLGLELFLPGVGKGLITGRSSVVWYALVQRLPVFNCDDETVRGADSVRDSYRAFGVPPCHGRLVFDPRAFDRIGQSVRQADLLELIQKEL